MTDLIQLRDATYREPELPEKRCETCWYFSFAMHMCSVDEKKWITANPLASCDAWAPKKGGSK